MQEDLLLVDSDALITAHRRYYSFDICPGFWNTLLKYHEKERIFSVQSVRKEILQGHDTDDLSQWVKNELPPSFFLEESSNEVVNAYKMIMMWAQSHSTYIEKAKAKFAKSADARLIAFALVKGAIIVTNEKSEPLSKKS